MESSTSTEHRLKFPGNIRPEAHRTCRLCWQTGSSLKAKKSRWTGQAAEAPLTSRTRLRLLAILHLLYSLNGFCKGFGIAASGCHRWGMMDWNGWRQKSEELCLDRLSGTMGWGCSGAPQDAPSLPCLPCSRKSFVGSSLAERPKFTDLAALDMETTSSD